MLLDARTRTLHPHTQIYVGAQPKYVFTYCRDISCPLASVNEWYCHDQA